MPLELTQVTVKNILTRTTGFLREVTSHSLQPYRGCTFGNALCGVGCYVQHSRHITQGRRWGGFLEVRTNAADSYLANCDRERRWAEKRNEAFSIFCSSATDPFVPQEFRYGITHSLLEAMCERPPDELVLQTHSHRVAECLPLLQQLATRCRLRVHVSIETDRERIAGLPPHASPVERRLTACEKLRAARLFTVVTVSPLLPIAEPERFFARIAEVADAVVLDHFIQGDGSHDGGRTLRTSLPAAMAAIDPHSVSLAYRDEMAACARRIMPGRVGVNIAGFAGRYG
jgi:DNA repair photolyase